MRGFFVNNAGNLERNSFADKQSFVNHSRTSLNTEKLERTTLSLVQDPTEKIPIEIIS